MLKMNTDIMLVCNVCGNPNTESKCRRVYDDLGEIEALACPHCGSEDLSEV